MRKRRTSLDARLIVTLSFSAHSTGSLAFVTSTAMGAGGWAAAAETKRKVANITSVGQP